MEFVYFPQAETTRFLNIGQKESMEHGWSRDTPDLKSTGGWGSLGRRSWVSAECGASAGRKIQSRVEGRGQDTRDKAVTSKKLGRDLDRNLATGMGSCPCHDINLLKSGLGQVIFFFFFLNRQCLVTFTLPTWRRCSHLLKELENDGPLRILWASFIMAGTSLSSPLVESLEGAGHIYFL